MRFAFSYPFCAGVFGLQDVIEKSEINAKAEADNLVNIFILSPPTFEYKKIDDHFC